jgi:hypothetical protein
MVEADNARINVVCLRRLDGQTFIYLYHRRYAADAVRMMGRAAMDHRHPLRIEDASALAMNVLECVPKHRIQDVLDAMDRQPPSFWMRMARWLLKAMNPIGRGF